MIFFLLFLILKKNYQRMRWNKMEKTNACKDNIWNLCRKKNKLRFPFKYHIINFIFKKSGKKSMCQDLKEWKNLYIAHKGKKMFFQKTSCYIYSMKYFSYESFFFLYLHFLMWFLKINFNFGNINMFIRIFKSSLNYRFFFFYIFKRIVCSDCNLYVFLSLCLAVYFCSHNSKEKLCYLSEG